jgi:toxin HigB-1
MDIYFHSRKLQRICSEERFMQKELGKKRAKKLAQRLEELRAADWLADISHLPPPRCHELTNRKGIYSVDLEHPYRLLFIPANDPVPLKEDGGIDMTEVTEIEIIAIEDTHDPKNQRRKK